MSLSSRSLFPLPTQDRVRPGVWRGKRLRAYRFVEEGSRCTCTCAGTG